LAENEIKPWRKDMWCIPQVDGEYVAHMEDVLDLYAEAPDPKRPVVCFDESPTQLIGEVRQPIPAEPGQIERYDCEYKRNGTANLFIFLDVHQPAPKWAAPIPTQSPSKHPRSKSHNHCAEVLVARCDAARFAGLGFHALAQLHEVSEAVEHALYLEPVYRGVAHVDPVAR
jgi:hypothetical protein